MFDVVSEFFFKAEHVYRTLTNDKNTVYLTFDDGPSGSFTESIVDILDAQNAKATFFVIANKAKNQQKLVKSLCSRGHQIGNHSLDHDHRKLFLSHKSMSSWIQSSESMLQDITGASTVGFRPPNGVLTPHVLSSTQELEIPIYLWSHRFFDSLKSWNEKQALQSLRQLRGGEIFLLHDQQKLHRQCEFLKTLDFFIKAGSVKGLQFKSLPIR
jgi:peptidoglycan-N-acetylglucosamine deacetylase